MNSAIVKTTNLTKRYGSRIVAVDRLNLTIRRGEVYGFLGPNGAGKTTVLKMLLGLIRPTTGISKVLGKNPGTAEGLKRVGALIESPVFYPYLSGKRNLSIMAKYSGVPRSRVDTVLEQVELTERSEDKFLSYSMGMKQRLGVAAALLKDPELLILDEPTNGLDPQGMTEMRKLIRNLGQGERTVLLSSHLLGEVEQICDRVGVIKDGKFAVEGTVDQLRGKSRLLVRANPMKKARKLAEEMFGFNQLQVSDNTLILAIKDEHSAEINNKLVANDVTVSEIRPIQQSLEDIYMELIGKGN